jgi:hypothetical protein
MQTQKGFSILTGIIIVLAIIAVILFGGIFAYQYFAPKSQAPTTNVQPNPSAQNFNTQTEPSSNNNSANTTTDYQLFAKIPQGEDILTPQIKYVDDGIVNSGTYNGYHRIIALQISGEMGRAINYFVFVTQDYKKFYLDPSLLKNLNYKSSLDKNKVVGEVSGVPLNHPESITLGNFILERQDYYSTETFEGYSVAKNSNKLTSNVPGLKFYDQQTQEPFQSGGDTDFSSGVTKLVAVDQFGLIFSYFLVSKENYARQVQFNKSDNLWHENPFYLNTDFSPSMVSYSSYGSPIPGGCGGSSSIGYVLKNISINDLISVGTTQSGTKLYTFADKNSSLNQEEYKRKIKDVYEAGYEGAQAAAEKMNNATEPSHSDYVAQNPILIVQDPWNRFVAFGEWQYKIPGGCGKPVIYFYPDNLTEVKLSFRMPVYFTTDIPTYKNGWDVLANPDGTIRDLQPQFTDCSKINTQSFGSEYAVDACKNNAYPYLYWAGQVDNIYPQVNTGWVVARENLTSFIDQKLTIIGLNEKERVDMISYWVPELTAKDAPYYRISFFQTADMNNFAPMNIFPAPDTVIRVFLDWSPLAENNISIQSETLNHIDRHGFTVVEWGGLKQ